MTARWRPVVLTWLLILVVTQAPYLRSELDPPPGTVFVGAYHWDDDIHNYLSFAQQAEDGHFLFANKLAPGEPQRLMISPEFWLVGRLSAMLGGRPFLAFRLLGIAAAFALLAALDRILRAAGLPESHRLPALLLVSTGGGLGGWLFLFSELPLLYCLDISSGLFPFAGLLCNPHWTTATALLLWSLSLFHSPARRASLLGLLLANVLAFTRPYEPVLLAGMLLLGALREPELRRRALVLALGLVPWAVYQLWLSLFLPSFSFYARAGYMGVPIPEIFYALGPALLMALLARGVPADSGSPMRRRLVAWAALASLVILIRRPGLQLQMLVGIGVPLLALGAVGLSRRRPAASWAAAALLSGTAAVSVLIVLRSDPHWHVPAERRNAAIALRRLCNGPDVVFAPPDIGLHVIALTRCRAYVSHQVGPDYTQRMSQVVAFYGSADPASRAALLDAACAAHVVLPGPSPDRPLDWLGPETDFRRSAVVTSGARSVEVHSRTIGACGSGGPER